MCLVDFWKIAKAIKYLSKENDEWGNVYKQYLFCLLLMFIVGSLRYVTECVISIFILYSIYVIVSHPPITNTIVSSSLYKWILAYVHPHSFLSKTFLT